MIGVQAPEPVFLKSNVTGSVNPQGTDGMFILCVTVPSKIQDSLQKTNDRYTKYGIEKRNLPHLMNRYVKKNESKGICEYGEDRLANLHREFIECTMTCFRWGAVHYHLSVYLFANQECGSSFHC